MEKKASALMGEPVIAGAIVVPKGYTSAAVLKDMFGWVIGLVLSKKVGVARQPQSVPGGSNEPLYLAVGSTKVGFCSIKRGFTGMSPDKLLAQHNRSDVQAIQIGGGLIPEVQFMLRDGTNYLFECPRLYLGKLKKVKELLSAQQNRINGVSAARQGRVFQRVRIPLQ